MRRRLRALSPVHVLAVVAVLALLARLYALDARVAHQDEARVAHWILHYVAVDAWEYRPIIHGPFLPHVNGVLFGLLGASDFTMRLVPAVFGSLLPLTALLFRTRLDDLEVVATGVLLAISPVLLYYSRFMRNDLILATLALATVGFVVRAIDTRERWYVYAAALAFALALTTKENALLYPVTWLGSLALLLDSRLLTARHRGDPWTASLRDTIEGTARGLRPWLVHVVAALAIGLLVAAAFYAPKPALYRIASTPALAPEVLRVATLGSWSEFLQTWGTTSMQEHSYVSFLGQYLELVATGAPLLLVAGVGGFLFDRYAEARSRPLVAFCAYWAGFSLLGYPIVTDIMAAWATIHAVVPMAIPAGVAMAALARHTATAFDTGRPMAGRIGLAALLLSGVAVGGLAANYSYVDYQSRDNPMAQYAQPSGDMKPTLARVEVIAASNDGVDVLFYGDEFYTPDEGPDTSLQIDDYDDPDDYGGGYAGWFARLPLPWYLDRYDANVTSTTSAREVADSQPPVVITLASEEQDVADDLTGYERSEHQGYLWGRPIVFFVRE
jgi:uncharacterized protein (TIGR03663 family)